jgi:spermidine synthase
MSESLHWQRAIFLNCVREKHRCAGANLLFEDGIAWVKNAPDASLDVIIIDSTDPVGPAEGLFNAPFYAECRRVLRPDGDFSTTK